MAKFECKDPENIQFMATFTYTLKEWRNIRLALMAGAKAGIFTHGVEEMAGEIISMANQAEKVFFPQKKSLEDMIQELTRPG